MNSIKSVSAYFGQDCSSPGETKSQICDSGMYGTDAGTKKQICTSNGTWSSWSSCQSFVPTYVDSNYAYSDSVCNGTAKLYKTKADFAFLDTINIYDPYGSISSDLILEVFKEEEIKLAVVQLQMGKYFSISLV
jgi:hypothetical protein